MSQLTFRLSVIGLGRMGRPMAEHLLKSFGDLTVWNRRGGRPYEIENVERLRRLGAKVAPTPADAAYEVVLTVLTDLEAVEDILGGDDGLMVGWKRNGIKRPILVIHGTVSPVGTAELATRLRDEGISVIDAAMSGGVVGAVQQELSIMVGGDAHDAKKLEPVFSAIGSTVRYLGPAGSGQLAKACNQVVVAAECVAISEAALLARSAGLDVRTVFELLGGGLAGSALLQQKGEKWITEDFQAGGSATNQLKDLCFVADAAKANDIVLPLTEMVLALFSSMIEGGEGELDHTGIYLTIKKMADHNSRNGA